MAEAPAMCAHATCMYVGERQGRHGGQMDRSGRTDRDGSGCHVVNTRLSARGCLSGTRMKSCPLSRGGFYQAHRQKTSAARGDQRRNVRLDAADW